MDAWLRGYQMSEGEICGDSPTKLRSISTRGVEERECKDQRKREGKGEREIPQSLGPRSSADLVCRDLCGRRFQIEAKLPITITKINRAKKCCNAQKYKKCCNATKMYINVAMQHGKKIIKNKCKKCLQLIFTYITI